MYELRGNICISFIQSVRHYQCIYFVVHSNYTQTTYTVNSGDKHVLQVLIKKIAVNQQQNRTMSRSPAGV